MMKLNIAEWQHLVGKKLVNDENLFGTESFLVWNLPTRHQIGMSLEQLPEEEAYFNRLSITVDELWIVQSVAIF